MSKDNHSVNISALQFLKMRKIQKRKTSRSKQNQLTLSFSESTPIEIHIPRSRMNNVNKEILGEKRISIELVRN